MNNANNANNINITNMNKDTSIYNSIFNNLIYYCKTIINHKIKWINNIWIKNCDIIHYIYYNKSIFSNYYSLKNYFYIREINNNLMIMRINNVSIIDSINNIYILNKILYISKFKNNLISLNQFVLERWILIIMKDNYIIIYDEFKIYNLIRNELCV